MPVSCVHQDGQSEIRLHQAGCAGVAHRGQPGSGTGRLDATQCTREPLSIREITGATGTLCAALQGTANYVAVLPCRAETRPPYTFTRGYEAVAHNCRCR
ncbi:hypothetical protein CNE_1c34940 [Cupriavidus necator N-1]|uniref:Uncharacterized protein n=1 Tax=Cupriavidus necator (strain ATCC 43291 / DSM 13513 / CCUG 52238 / LMG 8453 / N-1) TaxID=1042878 RepID=G0EZE8_CUPNN|nr:hypothetical protein CNE_1c34940 [Cupriavidus necator N-1]